MSEDDVHRGTMPDEERKDVPTQDRKSIRVENTLICRVTLNIYEMASRAMNTKMAI
jgi:hypothetical protein